MLFFLATTVKLLVFKITMELMRGDGIRACKNGTYLVVFTKIQFSLINSPQTIASLY